MDAATATLLGAEILSFTCSRDCWLYGTDEHFLDVDYTLPLNSREWMHFSL